MLGQGLAHLVEGHGLVVVPVAHVGLYGYEYLLDNRLDPSVFSLYDVWVANYGVQKPGFKSKYGMWQYTNDAKIDGISSPVSMNHCYKNYPSIMEFNHLNGF